MKRTNHVLGNSTSSNKSQWLWLLLLLRHAVVRCLAALAPVSRVLALGRLRPRLSTRPQPRVPEPEPVIDGRSGGKRASGCGAASVCTAVPGSSAPTRRPQTGAAAAKVEGTGTDAEVVALAPAVAVRVSDATTGPAAGADQGCAREAGVEPPSAGASLGVGASGNDERRDTAAMAPGPLGGAGGIGGAPLGAATGIPSAGGLPVTRAVQAVMLPYMPMLRLAVNRFQLPGIRPTDQSEGSLERLQHAVESRAGRYLVGAYVRAGGGSGCDVVLDTVEAICANAGGSGGGGGVLTSGAFSAGGVAVSSGGRRMLGLAASGGAGGVVERRRAVWADEVACGPDSWWRALAWHLGSESAARDPQLTLAEVRGALLQRPWWSPATWVWWARHVAVAPWWRPTGPRRRSAGGAAGAQPPARTATSAVLTVQGGRETAGAVAGPGAAPLGCVISCRVAAVAPRVVQLSQPAAAPEVPSSPPEVPSSPPEERLPAKLLRFQVAIAVCFDSSNAGSEEHVLSHQPRSDEGQRDEAHAAAHSGCHGQAAAQCCAGGACPLNRDTSLEVLLRHNHQYIHSYMVPAAAASAPAVFSHKPCRRESCRRHVTLWRDVCMPHGRMYDADSRLGPGLLLLEVRGSAQRSPAQRPVPVLLSDDPWVAEEVQQVLADKCTGAANPSLEDLLTDLGLFMQQLAGLRAASAAAIAHAAAGAYRHERERQQRCCCQHGRTRSGCGAGSGTSRLGAHVGSPEGSEDPATGGDAAADTAVDNAATPAAYCAACALQRVRELLQRLLPTAGLMCLGEHLLHHATASGWARTASYIASCLTDLHKVDVLVSATSGRRDAAEETRGGGGNNSNSGGGGGGLSMSPRRRRGRRLVRIGTAYSQAGSSALAAFGLDGWCKGSDFQDLLLRLREVDWREYGKAVGCSLGVPLLAGLLLRLAAWLAAQCGIAQAGWIRSTPLMALVTLAGIVAGEVLAERYSGTNHDARAHGRNAFSARMRR